MKRLITKRQQEILMLVHHEFQGLSREEAAKKLGISSQAINDALAKVRKTLPQYFPILTALEIKCYHFFVDEGWPVNEIAAYVDISGDSVQNALRRAKGKGMWWPKGQGRILSYDQFGDDETGQNWIDNHIKEQF